MNENEKPALGSTEAAVLTVVELIARAASMSEQHMSYWLDLYYQVRFKLEAAEIYGELCTKTEEKDAVKYKLDELDGAVRNLQCVVSGMLTLPEYENPGRTAEGQREWHSVVPPTPPDHYPPVPPRPAGRKEPDSVIVKLDELKDKVRNLEETIRRADSKPVNFKISPVEKDIKQKWLEQAAAEAVDRAVNAIDVSAMLGKEQEQHGGETPGASAPAEKDETPEPTPVMRGRETIKLQERAKSESRSEAVKKQKAAEREFKIRVAERLREARTHGVKVGDIVTASCGAVPDGAVLTILDGGFRPIADYRALDAALDQLAKDNTSTVTAEP